MDGLRVLNDLVSNFSFEYWDGEEEGNVMISQNFTFILAEKFTHLQWDSYGYPVSNAVWLVFEVKDIHEESAFFKKSGTKSSYGEVTWDGPFERVKPQFRSVSSFTPVEY